MRSLSAAALVLTVIISFGTALAEEPTRPWIVGTWQGTHNSAIVSDDTTRFVFTEEGGIVKWKMERAGKWVTGGYFASPTVHLDASGVVKELSPGSAKLEGKYDFSDVSTVRVGAPVRYELTGTPDELSGTGVGMSQPFPVTLKRLK